MTMAIFFTLRAASKILKVFVTTLTSVHLKAFSTTSKLSSSYNSNCAVLTISTISVKDATIIEVLLPQLIRADTEYL